MTKSPNGIYSGWKTSKTPTEAYSEINKLKAFYVDVGESQSPDFYGIQDGRKISSEK